MRNGRGNELNHGSKYGSVHGSCRKSVHVLGPSSVHGSGYGSGQGLGAWMGHDSIHELKKLFYFLEEMKIK